MSTTTKDYADNNHVLPSKEVHIIVFPFPAKGHINPSLHFCNRLASKGFKITLVTIVSAYKAFKTKATSLRIDIESIPDCAENTTNWDVYFRTFNESAVKSMTEFIRKKLNSPHLPPKIVIYDSMLPWMLDIAHGFGLPGACFFTQSCSVNAVYYHMCNGAIPKTPPPITEEDYIVSLPYLPPLKSNDLPGFAVFKEYTDVVSNLHADQFSNIDKIDYILFNTFHELELEVANWMISKWSILTVGPTISLIADKQKDEECRNYLFETNTEVCLKWLDERATDSVIYVSFGSFVTLKKEQMEEVAQGLIASSRSHNILWVVRDEEEEKEEYSKLSKDFKSKTSGKGLIINWCPQLDVLAHRAVSCFVTHCGWNSTLEALTSGMPMIAMPEALDQTNNAKFIADVWKVGVRVKVNENGIVTREEIEHCIKQVTVETEEGKEMRRNVMRWKELAKQAVGEGGSSDRNIEEFASKLMLL